MILSDLKAQMQLCEDLYKRVDKSSFKALSECMTIFGDVYDLFRIREQYKINRSPIPTELKTFFDRNDEALHLLSRRAKALADSLHNDFEKFSKNGPLFGQFLSFFKQNNSERKESSSSHSNARKSPTSSIPVSLDSILKIYNTNDKNVALRKAAHEGSVTHVELLINKFEADINSKSSNGFTALDWAFYRNHMEPKGVFNTLCKLGADQSILKPLLGKYTVNSESEFPIKDIALARAMKQENQNDISVLVDNYKANKEKAQEILDAETPSPKF